MRVTEIIMRETKQNLRNLMLSLSEDKPFITVDGNENDGSAVDIETVSQSDHSEALCESWSHNLNSTQINNKNNHGMDCHIDPVEIKNFGMECLITVIITKESKGN
ncbi:hypothetical protein CEXT_528751 [Caerostris extrusa]|uniref:Uncharacterized protein n=1 Tax=Caerostris extrusa TaxID=172846 RepID=A0AAV4YDK4_CAEEX|nr:hypothetical protein CEXT_528751 [Caerostris extrusa]